MAPKAITVWTSCLLAPAVFAQSFLAPLYDFITRPDLAVPKLLVDTYDPAYVAPGYIFLTPGAPEAANGVNFQFAPLIYDNEGELVWSGYDPETPRSVKKNFVVIQHQGKPHLAFAHLERPHPIHGDILDQNYQLVQRVHATAEENSTYMVGKDTHEFRVATPSTIAVDLANITDQDTSHWLRPDDPDTALMSYTGVRRLNHSVEICGQKITWVRDSPFQEVSLDGNNTVLFEWHAMEHIPVEEVDMCPGNTAHGTENVSLQGVDQNHPFDYIHRNAVDKLPDGDFIVSVRHTNTVYKVNHMDGSIVWRLGGGRRTDFNQTSLVPGVDLGFYFQHHLKYDAAVPGSEPAKGIFGLTLWDNANARYDFADSREDLSLGKTILVDQNTMTATLVSAFALPGNKLTTNQGSHQILLNGNHLIGGGNIAEIAEYRNDQGTWDAADAQTILAPEANPQQREPVFAAHFGGGPMNSYRAGRHQWTAYPLWKPAAFAYRQTCGAADSRTFVYASWNGATEVASWVVRGSADTKAAESDVRDLASTRRAGFETIIAVPQSSTEEVQRVYAVALDKDGNELGSSDPVAVWVPIEDDILLSHQSLLTTAEQRRQNRRSKTGECGEKRCRPGFQYEWDQANDCAVQ